MEEQNYISDQEIIGNALKREANRLFNKIVEEEAEAAAERIRERMKSEQDKLIVSMFDSMSYERIGPDLRITIHHLYEKPEKN